MKRIQMIERLQFAGYSATELSRMSNENLHATYVTARPLLDKNAAELAKVVSRERKRGQRLKAEIAREQQNRQAIEQYHQWSQSHLPKPIVARRSEDICMTTPQNPDVAFVSEELRKAKMELRQGQRDLKFRGGKEAMQKCEQARKKVGVWEREMQEVGK